MPKIVKFRIENFKGIEKISFDFQNRIESKIFTLIGLNESGKTTILEALSHFVTADRTTSELFEGPYAQQHIANLIPIHKSAAFTGDVSVSGELLLDDDDKNRIIEIFSRNGWKLLPSSIPDKMVASRAYTFEDSKFKKFMNYWSGFSPIVAEKGKKKFSEYKVPEKGSKSPNLWLESVNSWKDHLPQMVYFPTFLVDMPSKIYLSEHENEKPINRYYRTVIQDVLDSLGGNLKLETHVVKRIRDFKERDATPSWFPKFFEDPDRRSVEAVFQRLSAAITKEVLGNWQRVFNRPVSAKQIRVDWNIDSSFDDLPYATFSISDGESIYQINQRSLGFRWFFSFLLFTRFKIGSDRPTIFLFDEPAANLHARAQAQLLESFSKITNAGNFVIYSTHSHHMIEPRWLSGAYIVENESIDYDSDEYSTSFSLAPTNIKVKSYRDFVSHQPDRVSYFQPVVERLQYIEPIVVGSSRQIFLEGISDFNAFEYVLRRIGRPDGVRLVPGFGAGSLGPAISRSLSEARDFRILLDDDTAGRRAGEKYRNEWFLGDGIVFTLSDIDASLKSKKLENLIDSEVIKAVAIKFDGKRGKKQIGYYLAEAVSADIDDALDKKTFNRISDLLKKLFQTF